MNLPISEFYESFYILACLLALLFISLISFNFKKVYIDWTASRRVNKRRNSKRTEPLTDFEKYLRKSIIVDGDKFII